jgi:ATP-dependent RNA helicase SUPV3L1/SUV3
MTEPTAALPPTPPKPRPLLPEAGHLRRIPADITPEQLQRVQRDAIDLPHVLEADRALPDSDAQQAEKLLDEMGWIKLQRAVPGQRPGRWIEPRLIAVALAHLDTVGRGAVTRPVRQARSTELERLGLERDLDGWWRLVRQPIALDDGTLALQLAFEIDQDDAPIWAFHRDGDRDALLQALGPAPDYPERADLTGHLQALLTEARQTLVQTFGEEREAAAASLDALMAGLQAECGLPQRAATLRVACTRALERWQHRVREQHAIRSLNTELAFQGYPDSFPLARRLNRQITLYVGPPNSGKTYAAFERLASASSGAYLAPLRLLALEGRDRLQGRGVPCSLRTGEEQVPVEGARAVSSTIEMVDTRTEIDVAVIDEAQMIFDPSRGWAWTQAIVAVPAREVIIIGSEYAAETIDNLLGLCGERCTVRRFERKQEVELLNAPVPLTALHQGDAVVAFSRRDVLMLRDQISRLGCSVSVIYGALPPEVRRREAERFAQGESEVLVATDAIGMGLNLPIRRVLFSTLTKFDGQGDRLLTESEVHQIAGRAGRFGIHEEGFTGVLHESEAAALKTLRQLLPRTPRAPRHFRAPVAPNWGHIDTIASRLGLSGLHEVLRVFMNQLQLDDQHFAVADLEPMLLLAEQLDQEAPELSLKQRFIYAQAPVDSRTDGQVQAFLSWARSHARTGQAGWPWFLDEVDERSRLDRMEQALRACALWLWLDLRFPGIYGEVEPVLDLRERLNDGIERQIKSHKPLWQSRRGKR